MSLVEQSPGQQQVSGSSGRAGSVPEQSRDRGRGSFTERPAASSWGKQQAVRSSHRVGRLVEQLRGSRSVLGAGGASLSIAGWQWPCDGGQARPRDPDRAPFHACWASR